MDGQGHGEGEDSEMTEDIDWHDFMVVE